MTPRVDAFKAAQKNGAAYKMLEDWADFARVLERELIAANGALSKERSDKERFARELLMHTTGKSYVENGSKTHARWCMLCDTESPPDAERLTHKPGCLIAEAEEALASAPCEQCGGTGIVTLKGVPNGIGFEMDADDQPCPECK